METRNQHLWDPLLYARKVLPTHLLTFIQPSQQHHEVGGVSVEETHGEGTAGKWLSPSPGLGLQNLPLIRHWGTYVRHLKDGAKCWNTDLKKKGCALAFSHEPVNSLRKESLSLRGHLQGGGGLGADSKRE